MPPTDAAASPEPSGGGSPAPLRPSRRTLGRGPGAAPRPSTPDGAPAPAAEPHSDHAGGAAAPAPVVAAPVPGDGTAPRREDGEANGGILHITSAGAAAPADEAQPEAEIPVLPADAVASDGAVGTVLGEPGGSAGDAPAGGGASGPGTASVPVARTFGGRPDRVESGAGTVPVQAVAGTTVASGQDLQDPAVAAAGSMSAGSGAPTGTGTARVVDAYATVEAAETPADEPDGAVEADVSVASGGATDAVGSDDGVEAAETPTAEPDEAATVPPAAPGGSGGGEPGPGADGRFTVRLANFEGPFDLLLQLISKHKLDVTEVALSKVTDEFMAHIRAMGPDWDLDQTTEFLVVAATLLDLKAARLLPAAEVEDEADLALLEARDLLFARLLQYRAYKQIAEIFNDRLQEEARRYPRTVGLEPHHAELLPEVVISIGAEGFAKLAVKAMQPRAKPQVYVDHIHAPLVSVREQAEVVVRLLRERGRASFRELVDGVGDTLTVVARFLALLELYRERAVALDQEDALGELVVTWSGGDEAATVTDEFDRAPENMEDTA